jgi:hypothetical protein
VPLYVLEDATHACLSLPQHFTELDFESLRALAPGAHPHAWASPHLTALPPYICISDKLVNAGAVQAAIQSQDIAQSQRSLGCADCLPSYTCLSGNYMSLAPTSNRSRDLRVMSNLSPIMPAFKGHRTCLREFRMARSMDTRCGRGKPCPEHRATKAHMLPKASSLQPAAACAVASESCSCLDQKLQVRCAISGVTLRAEPG